MILLSLLLCLIVMLITWKVALEIRNAGIVDIVWSYCFLPVAVLWSLAVPYSSRTAVILFLVALWSLRLGTYLAIRFQRTREEGRYAALRKEWKKSYPKRLRNFFLVQGVSIPFLAIPFGLFLLKEEPLGTGTDILGALIVLIGIAGESLADYQLLQFKKRNKGVLMSGLWKYSRHPNYFFEWVVWCGFATLALGAPFGYLGLLSPLCIYCLLTQSNGVPRTEAQILKNRGVQYERYQRSTPRFFPWFPKTE